MTQSLRTVWLRTILSCVCILIVAVILLTACDDDTEPKKHQSDDQARLQVQLESERAMRLGAEQSARAAEESRNLWLIGVTAGACVACIIVGLLGIHIGVRGANRARREPPHE